MKALARLCGCAGSPEPLLVAYTISTKISWAGSLQCLHTSPFRLLLHHLGHCNNHLLNKLIKFQKRAARLILDKDNDTPSAELFQQLSWMRFDECVTYRKAVLMNKSLHNLAPTYINNKFTYTSGIHLTDRFNIICACLNQIWKFTERL